ncbi:MAG: Hsp20/alpha crystallin family protein [Deltaproteobacteria bacterium]|nr:Hsp20/alpha crystallin family protein [Deltaproteobacteria bacterium]
MLTVFDRNLEPRRFANLRPWFNGLDDWFTDDWRVAARERATGYKQTPRVQVDEDETKYTLSLEIPGVSRDNITIELTANNLVVTGERKHDEGDASGSYTKFERTFTLPDGVKAEDISADHRDGVLRLFVQKPVAAKPVKIVIGEAKAEKSCCATT